MSGVNMLHGFNRNPSKNVRVSSNKLKQDKIIDGADNPPHTTHDAVSFRVQPTDAHSRRLVPDDRSRPACESMARKRPDRVARRSWLIIKLWLRFRLDFAELRISRPTVHGRASNRQDQPESSSQWFAYPYFCPGWPEHLSSSHGHWLGTAVFFLDVFLTVSTV